MGPGCLLGDAERLSDGSIRQTVAKEVEHVEFTGREARGGFADRGRTKSVSC